MVRAGEETRKMSEAPFIWADYMDVPTLCPARQNAWSLCGGIIYCGDDSDGCFCSEVVASFAEPPGALIYTKLDLDSDFFVMFSVPIALFLAFMVYLFRYISTPQGQYAFDRFKINIPYVGRLYRKLFLARISDNMNTMLSSGISMVRVLEISGDVVDNEVYKKILLEAAEAIKAGSAVSSIFARYPEIPGVMVQMIKVGEESGKIGFVLEKLSRFYEREVGNEVDTLLAWLSRRWLSFCCVGIMLTASSRADYNLAQGI